ncbi:DUF2062 domain-containing protein [Brevibacillus ruminantium]|uniref:DUF2062 domain-containing protein n=1 Tax=Brevibacillus ruminantium TaxID=2950604 RepID=A0ABY4WML1_9BACL|nr:DUF2062 domain-containing protein [Brevibacillus ruminantium]USG67277.1 DUF2062 domain-containing protein [Brevibacillus ruminantium]
MWKKIYRKMKYEYYKLIRMKGAPSYVARGFSVGIFVEFITLPTFGLAFLLLFPLVKLFRCSFPAALIAFVIGKMVLPVFMVLNYRLGYSIIGRPLKEHLEHNNESVGGWLVWMKEKGLAYFTGSAVMGLVVAIGSYFLVFAALQLYRRKRAKRTPKRDGSSSSQSELARKTQP